MKTVLITGASSGIGKETAYIYAQNNYNLILSARRKENLETIKKEIQEKNKVQVDIVALDLSKTDSAEKLHNFVKEAGLSPDILINNAGFGMKGNFRDTDVKREESMLTLNMITLTKLTKLFLKDMLNNNSGYIINIASTAAFQGIPGMACYAATKAYVLHFTEALSEELKNTGVKAIVINPGATISEFAETAGFEKEDFFSKAPTSKDLAEFIFSSMKKGKSFATHGFKNKLMIASSAIAPRKITTKIAGNMIN